MRAVLLISVIVTHFCYGQDDYNSKLSTRLDEIKKLTSLDNSVVIYADTSSQRFGFPRWTPKQDFYMNDMVTLNGKLYEALVDNIKGKNPTTSPNEWRLIDTRHPYSFLRDTATVEDLKRLLNSDNVYIRVYSFGALVHRNYSDLFQIILDNLKDTTRIEQMTGDVGTFVTPSDMMLSYTVSSFDDDQKDLLKKLILTKHNHLETLKEILLFHKPSTDSYPFVKAIAKKGNTDKFGLIALSQYCRPEDIELIKTGFNLDIYKEYYNGYKIFFKAIENCPEKAFKKDLISYKSHEISKDIWVDEYYVRALASYKDKECLAVLKELSKLDSRYKSDNLAIIYRALKKHYTRIYDKLMGEIKKSLADKDPYELNQNLIEESPWNY
jgi:hypothetical protein